MGSTTQVKINMEMNKNTTFCEDMFISQCMIDIITNEMSVIVDLYNGIGYNQIEFSREKLIEILSKVEKIWIVVA